MRIRIFGFTSDSRKPPNRYGFFSALLSCVILGWILVQNILKGEFSGTTILILSIALATALYHLFYQARGLYRQKKKQEVEPASVHKTEEPDYELPRKGENFYCPHCGRAVEQDFEFCNTCGNKLP